MKTHRGFSKRSFRVEISGYGLSAGFIAPDGGPAGGSGPTLVFLHEGLGSIAQWRDFPEALCEATGLPGLVYERRGHGRSDPLAGTRTVRYLHDEALDVLPSVLEQSGISKAILIGHSDGGSIALIFASAYPERVVGVVTEAAHVFVEAVTVEGIRQAVKAYETTNLREQLQRYHGENTDAIFHAWADIWLSPAFQEWNIESCLSGITRPLLIIQGQDDAYGTVAQVESIVKQAGGTAIPMVIPGCGHIPHQQAREQVLEAIGRFISSILKSD